MLAFMITQNCFEETGVKDKQLSCKNLQAFIMNQLYLKGMGGGGSKKDMRGTVLH